MVSYYYLMAQLPVLIYDQKPPMSSDSFRSLAESLLNKKDASLMKYLSLDPDNQKTDEKPAYKQSAKKTGCNFIDNWREWERTLRLNLAKNRAHNLKRENENMAEAPVVPMEAATVAAKAVAGDQSPLDAELLIDKVRWSTVCSMAGHNYFGRDNVFAYYLKLVLMERKALFITEKGFSEYKSLYAEITDGAHKSLGEQE